MIQIEKERCLRCGSCVSVCPFTVLHIVNDIPELNPKKQCLKCMHCAAACPSSAISFEGESAVLPEPLLEFSPDFSKQLKGFLLGRRSYRHFKPVPVASEQLVEALDLSRWAPSAKNQHPVKFVVVNGKEKVDQVMAAIFSFVKETGTAPEILSEYENGNNVVAGTAQTLILAYAGSKAVNPPGDTTLALVYAELYLQSLGVGTCWAGYLTRMANNVPALKELFALPENHQFYGALMAGYPKGEQYFHLPQRINKTDITWL